MEEALAYAEMGMDAQMLEQLKLVYVGIDLHKAEHTAVLMNYGTKKLDVITFENKPAAFPAFRSKRHDSCLWARGHRRLWQGVSGLFG
jgi:hypothetical protein